jgi:ParB-like chromosome segregation protein Spo0J
LQQPITVWDTGYDSIHLIAGRHRLAAAEKLGWETIECFYVDMDDLDRQLWEIDENLMRADLTEEERADHTARRAKVIKAQIQLTAKPAPNSKRGPKNTGVVELVKEIAEQSGRSERSVYTDLRRGEKITDATKAAIADTPTANSGVELDALASLNPNEQTQAVERVESGASKNYREAHQFIKGVDVKEGADPKQVNALMRAWDRASDDSRKLFFTRIKLSAILTRMMKSNEN